MNKNMKVKAWWLMRVGLLLAGLLLAMCPGCARPAKCDEAGVVCADELGHQLSFIPSSKKGENDSYGVVAFTSPKFSGPDPSKYKIDAECDGCFWGFSALVAQGDALVVGAALVPKCGPTRCEFEVKDADPALGTSQKVSLCLDAQGKLQDCKAYAAAPAPDPVKVTNDNAAAVAPKVRCGMLTYTVTDQVYAGGKVPWSDLTWTMRAPSGYDMGKPAISSGITHADPLFPGAFKSKASDLAEMLSESIITTKLIVSLAAGKAIEVRLPIRYAVADLVNTNKTNTDVLRAGWDFKDSASGKEVNIGCSIKQTVLASIVDTALAGKPIGDQTVHILFNAASDKQPVGENGWCYGLTGAGQKPLFKPYRSTETGKLCATYP